MKRTSLLKTMLLLCALIVGSSSVWAENALAEGTYNRVTNVNELTVGAKIIFVSEANNTAAGLLSTSSAKYREAVSIEISDHTTTVSSTNNITEFTVGGSSNAFTFHDGNGYINSTSASGANLNNTGSTTDSKSKWTVTISNGIATIKNNGNTSRYIKYNSDSPRFACYAGSYDGPVCIYIKDNTPTIDASDVEYEADITSGEIVYSISNPVSGKSLNAITSTKWISDISVTSTKVTFNMTENTGDAREGSITLQYEGATDKVVTVSQAAAVNKFAVTFEAPSNGTLTVKRGQTVISSGDEIPTGTELTIEATPNLGYSFTNWEYKTDGDWTEGTGTSYIVTSSVQFRATFAEIPKYTVTLSDDTEHPLTESYGGEGVTLPSRSDVVDYAFAGWSATEVASETTSKPTLILAGAYNPTENITLYPVYQRVSGSLKNHSININSYAAANNITDTQDCYTVTIDGEITASSNDAATTNPKLYKKDNAFTWRVYKDATLTIASSTDNIYSITVTADSDFGLKYGTTNMSNGVAQEVSGKSVDLSLVAKTFITDILVVTGNQTFYYTSHPITTVNVSVSAATWASFSCDRPLDFEGTDVTAYIAKAKDDSNVTLTSIKKVPANTGIVVNAAANTYNIPVLSSDADATTGNLLKPWLTAGEPTESTYYTLAVDGSNNPVFYTSTGGTLAAGKAYLVMPSGNGAPSLAVSFGESTGVNDVKSKMEEVRGEYFNLAGQRVAQPTKGLYIVNGKKYVVK